MERLRRIESLAAANAEALKVVPETSRLDDGTLLGSFLK